MARTGPGSWREHFKTASSGDKIYIEHLDLEQRSGGGEKEIQEKYFTFFSFIWNEIFLTLSGGGDHRSSIFGLVGLLRHLIYIKTSSFEISQVSQLEVISVICGKIKYTMPRLMFS